MPRVSAVSGKCKETTSADCKSSSKLHSSTPCSPAKPEVYLSYASTLHPNPRRQRANDRPMFPNPMIPTVRASSSKPRWPSRSQPPPRTCWSARVSLCNKASSCPTACSPTAVALPSGEEMTRTPRRSASATSMLSKPAPLRAIHCSSGSASSSAASTVSRERSTMPLQVDSAPASTSSRDVVSACRQSMPAAVKRSMSTSWTVSRNATCAIKSSNQQSRCQRRSKSSGR